MLKTTQSFVPYIKQYGPLIKSLPELIQVFKSDDKVSETNPKAPVKVAELDRPSEWNFLTKPSEDIDYVDEHIQSEGLQQSSDIRPSCLTIEAFEEIVESNIPALFI